MVQSYIIQENGQVTLPEEWRDKYGLKKGDVVSFIETENGLMVLPGESIITNALDEIGETLKEQGITLEQLMDDGRTIRGEMLKELYGLESSDE